MGMRELTEEQFELFVDAIAQAEKVLQDREEAKATCFERIEKELIPLGVSGIEDLLQDEVMDTIDVRASLLLRCSIFVTAASACG